MKMRDGGGERVGGGGEGTVLIFSFFFTFLCYFNI